MKKLHLIIVFFLFSASLFAQSPQGLNYQAIARNSVGAALTNQNISIRFTISDSIGSNVYYEETQSVTTNSLGLFTLNIGNGAVVSGTFSSISWSAITPWLKVEMDPPGGSNYTTMGSSKLLSVPYAMYAASAPGPQVTTISGFAGVIDGGASGYIFAGPTVSITLTSTKVVTGVVAAPLGMTLSGSQDFIYDLIYQNTSTSGPITNFAGSNNYSSGTASSTRVSWTAAGSVVLPAGTYNIGFGVWNAGGDQLDNNDYVNGWIMVSNP